MVHPFDIMVRKGQEPLTTLVQRILDMPKKFDDIHSAGDLGLIRDAFEDLWGRVHRGAVELFLHRLQNGLVDGSYYVNGKSKIAGDKGVMPRCGCAKGWIAAWYDSFDTANWMQSQCETIDYIFGNEGITIRTNPEDTVERFTMYISEGDSPAYSHLAAFLEYIALEHLKQRAIDHPEGKPYIGLIKEH